MFCDYHVHTHYSDDSEYLMEDVIKDAIEIGIDELCFTDHVDYGIKVDWDSMLNTKDDGLRLIANVDYPKYFKEIEYLQDKYPQINIKKGMEFGVQTGTIPKFEELYHKYNYDFIIFSCHQIEDQEFWNQEFQQGKTQQEYNKKYYEEILSVVKNYKDYSVLGHLDLIKRYDKCGIYPFEEVKDIITEIFKVIIQDGKGIEVNTSCYRYGLKDLTPSRDILKLYKDMGGEIITIGSDSHIKEHLGAYINDTKNELKKLGFKKYCTFENMKPIFHDL